MYYSSFDDANFCLYKVDSSLLHVRNLPYCAGKGGWPKGRGMGRDGRGQGAPKCSFIVARCIRGNSQFDTASKSRLSIVHTRDCSRTWKKGQISDSQKIVVDNPGAVLWRWIDLMRELSADVEVTGLHETLSTHRNMVFEWVTNQDIADIKGSTGTPLDSAFIL